MDLLYEEVKAEVVTELKDCDVAVTTDLWTSLAMQGYITVTCHFINKDWILKSIVIATRVMDDRHSGSNIAQHLRDIQTEFGIRSLVGITTDNASNMLVAADELGVVHIACFTHTLQLVVNDALKHPTVVKALAVGRKLVAHFNHSVISTQALLRHQERLGSSKRLRDV